MSKNKNYKRIEELDASEWAQQYIGYQHEFECPKCGNIVWENQKGDRWCDVECGWANTQELQDEIKNFFATKESPNG